MVDLTDLYNGRVLNITLNKRSICQHCRGSGADNIDDVETCTKCGGRGIYI